MLRYLASELVVLEVEDVQVCHACDAARDFTGKTVVGEVQICQVG